MRAAPAIDIPQITQSILQDADKAYQTALRICDASRLPLSINNPIPGFPINLLSKTRKAARAWIETIEPYLDTYLPAPALKIAHAYDHLHRIAYTRPPLHHSPHHRQIHRALQASIKGDTDVDQYLLFRLITLGLNQGIKEYRLLPLRWQSQKLTAWYKKYRKILSRPFQSLARQEAGISEAIRPEEIRLLLISDLTPFTGRNQAPFKNTLRALLDCPDKQGSEAQKLH